MFRLSPRFPHTQQKQYPRTVLEQQLYDAMRYNPDWSHNYVQRPKIPQTTVANYAYVTQGLSEFSPIGHGIQPSYGRAGMRSIASNGRPMLYFSAVPVQGLGGLVQGQIFGQPLIDPNAPPMV